MTFFKKIEVFKTSYMVWEAVNVEDLKLLFHNQNELYHQILALLLMLYDEDQSKS